ncbi:MAG: hypothetical protein Q6362_002125 [Candidatus Wukongarchaeota archaeon]|nr:hypothetical protein [Candidatus Wukongarchaeota archaeon]
MAKSKEKKAYRYSRRREMGKIKPLNLIIIGKDGRCLFSRNFSEFEGDKEIDPDLVSAFLAAFSSQAARVFKARVFTPPIDRLSGGDTSYIFEWGEKVFVASAIKDASEEEFGLSIEKLREKLREFIILIEEKFSDFIENIYVDDFIIRSLEELTKEMFSEYMLKKERIDPSAEAIEGDKEKLFFGWVGSSSYDYYQQISILKTFLEKNNITKENAAKLMKLMKTPKNLGKLIKDAGKIGFKTENLEKFLLFLYKRTIINIYRIS